MADDRAAATGEAVICAGKIPTIFVNVASYRDPECSVTVSDLFAKAARPNAITVGCASRSAAILYGKEPHFRLISA